MKTGADDAGVAYGPAQPGSSYALNITDQGHLGIYGTASCSVADASFSSKKLRQKQIICGVELHEVDED